MKTNLGARSVVFRIFSAIFWSKQTGNTHTGPTALREPLSHNAGQANIASPMSASAREVPNTRRLNSLSQLSVIMSDDGRSSRVVAIFFGPILWGHSGPLCHALSLSLWTSI